MQKNGLRIALSVATPILLTWLPFGIFLADWLARRNGFDGWQLLPFRFARWGMQHLSTDRVFSYEGSWHYDPTMAGAINKNPDTGINLADLLFDLKERADATVKWLARHFPHALAIDVPGDRHPITGKPAAIEVSPSARRLPPEEYIRRNGCSIDDTGHLQEVAPHFDRSVDRVTFIRRKRAVGRTPPLYHVRITEREDLNMFLRGDPACRHTALLRVMMEDPRSITVVIELNPHPKEMPLVFFRPFATGRACAERVREVWEEVQKDAAR